MATSRETGVDSEHKVLPEGRCCSPLGRKLGGATGRAGRGKNRIQERYKAQSRPENSYLRKRRRSHDAETAKGKPKPAQEDLKSAVHRASCRGPREPEPVYLEQSRLVTHWVVLLLCLITAFTTGRSPFSLPRSKCRIQHRGS